MRIGLLATPARTGSTYKFGTEHFFEQTGGNTGNLAFVYAIHQQLGKSSTVIPWYVDPIVVRESFDVIVIACANQLGPHTDLGEVAERLELMKLPILAVGLGAQAERYDEDVKLTPGTRRWVDVIASHAMNCAPNIGVRGDFTLKQLERIGLGSSGVVVGCPSNFINSDTTLGTLLTERWSSSPYRRIFVAAGHAGWEMLMHVERQLIALLESHRGEYIVQSEIDMMRLARREIYKIEDGAKASIHNYIKPLLSLVQFEEWCLDHATIYGDVDSWMERLRSADFIVGCRFHGVMLGIQAGIPGGVIVHDSRTEELCSTMAIPHIHWSQMPSELKAEQLPNLFPFDENRFSERRRQLASSYTKLLRASEIDVDPELLQLSHDSN